MSAQLIFGANLFDIQGSLHCRDLKRIVSTLFGQMVASFGTG